MFKKNTAVTGFQIGHFIQTADGAAKTTGTPACKRLLDGTPGTLTNAASYDSTAGVWKIDLAAADTNGDMVGLSFTLADCLPIGYTLRTTTKLVSELNDYAGADTSGVTTLLARIIGTLATGTHNPQSGDAFVRLGAPAGASVSADVAAVKAETALIVEDTGTTLPAALTAIDDFIDTEVAAIKAKTDNLPSDPADQSAVEAAITSATSSLATAANLAVVDTVVDAILADTGTDGVKIHTTQGAVTFGQVKILASASGEGAFHIVNSASGSSGKGMYVEGGEQGTMNYASESGGIALRNRATGSFSYGQINESTGASGTGQGNAGAFADINGDITGSISGVAAGGIDTTTFTSGALNAIADAVLKRDWSGLTGEASRSLLNALRFLRNKWSISGTTLTVTKEDDATSAWTATLSTDAAADPVTGSDPA